MTSTDEFASLLTLAKAIYGREIRTVRRTSYESFAQQTQSVAHVKDAYVALQDLASQSAVPARATSATRPGWEARRAAFLAAAKPLVNQKIAPHMRSAKLRGLGASAKQRGVELDALAQASDVTAQIADYVEKAEQAAEAVAKLAANPLKYYDMAQSFVNNKVLKFARFLKMPISPSTSMATTGAFLDKLKASNYSAKMFSETAELFERMSKFLGILQVTLLSVSLAFSTAAHSGRWARTLITGGFAIGAAFAIDALGSSAAASTAIGSTLAGIAAAAGITAEVPPVAIVLVAAGLVIAATVAVTKLFDFLINTLFGPAHIPRKMRAMMSAPMAHAMTASLST